MRSEPKDDKNWTVAGAKARLSEVIERAQSSPQTITRNGKPSVVVVSAEEWQRKTARKGTLAEFLLDSPLRGADLDLAAVFQNQPVAVLQHHRLGKIGQHLFARVERDRLAAQVPLVAFQHRMGRRNGVDHMICADNVCCPDHFMPFEFQNRK